MFSFLLGIYGMSRLKMHPEKYDDALRIPFRRTFLWTSIFSILIIVEDVIVIFNFDNYGVPGIHITNRSFTENLMSIYFVYTALRFLAPYLRSLMVPVEAAASAGNADGQASSVESADPADSVDGLQADFSDDVSGESFVVSVDEDKNVGNQGFSDQADYSKFYLFCREYQFTVREQDIFRLLLKNKNYSEISEELYISIGTAKAHMHNIFKKTEVKKRSQLIALFENFKKKEL